LFAFSTWLMLRSVLLATPCMTSLALSTARKSMLISVPRLTPPQHPVPQGCPVHEKFKLERAQRFNVV
jgi:hypothetical protein